MRAMPQIAMDVFQHFCPGVYMREIHMPAGAIVTGRIHKNPCLNILLAGELEVATEHGQKRLIAPEIFKSPAGTKRALVVIRDSIFITVHANPKDLERDSDAMADLLTVPSYELLESRGSQAKPEKE